MPAIEVYIDSAGGTVSSPHRLPFIIDMPASRHGSYPVYLRSLAARFASTSDLPTKMEIHATNLQHDPLYTQIHFPLNPTLSTAPSFHYHTNIHLGEISSRETIEGYILVTGPPSVQLPSQMSMLWFVDSQYM